MPAGTKKKVSQEKKRHQEALAPSARLSFFLFPLLVVLGGCAYAWYQLHQVDSGVGDSHIARDQHKDGPSSKSKKQVDGVRIQEPRKGWNAAYMDTRIGKQRCDLAVLDMKKGSSEAFENWPNYNSIGIL